MNALTFTKMHGLGNDFMVIDGTAAPVTLSAEQVQKMADRHFGVGFDQLLIVDPSPAADIDFGYRIFNADGSEVEQCGNGARCFARFVRERGLSNKPVLRVATRAGVIELAHVEQDLVQVNMGVPKCLPEEIPFVAGHPALLYPVKVAGDSVELSVVNMGNPHAVIKVEALSDTKINRIGPALESHARFPKRVNVGFMQMLSRHEIRLRVYERGTGETLACGSGACAAVVAGRRNGWLDEEVLVHLPGGDLNIRWAGDGSPVMMQGPAAFVYEGQWLLA